jgi:NitT/TauT family transport system permease protein
MLLISPICLLLFWEAIVQAGFADRRFVPPPSDVAVRFVMMARSGELAEHVGASLMRITAGYLIGVLPAIALGLVMAMSTTVRYLVDPLIALVYPIPKIAIMPLLLLALGFGEASKIAVVAIATFFPVVINTYAGAANIEKIYLDAAKNFGATQSIMFRRIVFFGALPMIFAGLRLAMGIAFLVIVSAEFVASKTGIGTMIWASWELLQVDQMFVGIVVIGVLGLLSTWLLQELERIVIPWKH